MKRMLIITGLVWLAFAIVQASAHAADLTIENYTLVSQKRITRTIWEIAYKANIINPGQEALDVKATVISTSAHTVVVEGSLSFGNVPIGGIVASQDTFTIRHDRSYPFVGSALVWDIRISGIGVDPDGKGLATTDANAQSTIESALRRIIDDLHRACVCAADKADFINKLIQLQHV